MPDRVEKLSQCGSKCCGKPEIECKITDGQVFAKDVVN